MIRRMRRLATALMLLAIAGCAERWSRPGTSEAEAETALASCHDRSLLAVPVHNVWQIVEPAGYDRDRRCWRDRDGRERCHWVSRWRPARWGLVDVNAAPRQAWARECMRDQGFTFEGYRPLRLE